MGHVLYIDPVTGDDVMCCEDEERARAKHWKEVAATLAALVLEERDEAVAYARQVSKATLRYGAGAKRASQPKAT